MNLKKRDFYHKTNNLAKLQVFMTVFEEKNTVLAAKILGISQPAVSMQIKAAEELVGCQLFEKIGNQLFATRHGCDLYESIHKHIGKIDFAIKNLKNINHPLKKKRIHIAVHHIFATRILGKYLQQADTDVEFFVHDISRQDAIKKLKVHEIDIAIYPFYDKTPDLASAPIAQYKPLLALHKSNPLVGKTLITPADIATQNLIKIKKEHIILPLFNQFAEQYKWQSRIQFDTPDWALLTHLVRSNLGVAVVSEICLESDKDIAFKDLSHIFPLIEYSIILNPTKIYDDNVKKFLSMFPSILSQI